jgi:hypothetical protein
VRCCIRYAGDCPAPLTGNPWNVRFGWKADIEHIARTSGWGADSKHRSMEQSKFFQSYNPVTSNWRLDATFQA